MSAKPKIVITREPNNDVRLAYQPYERPTINGMTLATAILWLDKQRMRNDHSRATGNDLAVGSFSDVEPFIMFNGAPERLTVHFQADAKSIALRCAPGPGGFPVRVISGAVPIDAEVVAKGMEVEY